jgi:hypothetical protein
MNRKVATYLCTVITCEQKFIQTEIEKLKNNKNNESWKSTCNIGNLIITT